MKIFTFKKKNQNSNSVLVDENKKFDTELKEEQVKVEGVNEMNSEKTNNYCWWDKIGRWSLLLLVFLLPFFFLPWTFWPVQFNKEILAVLLVSISLICWLGKSISQGKIIFVKSKYNWFIGLFLILLLIPVIFSVQKMKSLIGGFVLPDSYLSFLLFALVFFLAGIFFSKKDKTIISYVFGGSLVITSFLTIIQILEKFYPTLRNLLHINFFGSVIGLGVYLSIGLVAILSLFLVNQLSRWKKILLFLFSILILFELIIINYYLCWLILAISLIIEISYLLSLQKSKHRSNRLGFVSMIVVLTISVCFLIFGFSLPSKWIALPAEITPSWHLMTGIAQNVWHGRSFLVGSGLSTFNYDYTLYRPENIMRTQFWNISFNQGTSVISTILSTGGLIGLLAWLTLILGIILLNIRLLKEKNELFIWFFIGSIIFLLMIIFYPVDFVLLTLFFFIAGFLLANVFKKKEIVLTQTPQRAMFSFLGMFLIIIAILIGDYWVGRKYVAAVYAQNGVNLLSEKKTDLAIGRLSNAINLDNNNSQYYLILNQALWQKIPQELKNSKNKDSKKQAEVLIQQSIYLSNQATKIDPKNAINWVNLGTNYRSLIGLVNDSGKFSIEAYQKAKVLDPVNPIILMNMARSYSANANLIQQKIRIVSNQSKVKTKKDTQKVVQQLKSDYQKNLSLAGDTLKQALRLKPNYFDANYLLVQINVKQGQTNQAIDRLKQMAEQFQSNADIPYLLGQLYYSQKNLKLSQKNFERAIKINPNFSNARYLLGSIYKQQGNKKAALQQFKKILKLNPNNARIKSIIKELEGKELEGKK